MEQSNQEVNIKVLDEQLKQIYPSDENAQKQRQNNDQLGQSTIKGYDFNKPEMNYDEMFKSYFNCGLQATHLYEGIQIINEMIKYRGENQRRCTIFLGYTSNMISSGTRETIKFLAQHKMIDCIVSSAGGIEEDFMKCLADFSLGEFHCDDKALRKQGIHRIGNIMVPSENYQKLEDWLIPHFYKMYEIQEKEKKIWSPSSIINYLGKEINNEDSVYYWCWKNNIPVFCPGLTDGAIGDMLFYFSYKVDNFIVDLIQDIRAINKIALSAEKSGVIILGGGIVKHHILNANIWRNGADWGVFVNTGLYQEGSDSGALISEAISWGKLKLESKYTKIFSEASIIFPILVSQTFKKYYSEAKRN